MHIHSVTTFRFSLDLAFSRGRKVWPSSLDGELRQLPGGDHHGGPPQEGQSQCDALLGEPIVTPNRSILSDITLRHMMRYCMTIMLFSTSIWFSSVTLLYGLGEVLESPVLGAPQ